MSLKKISDKLDNKMNKIRFSTENAFKNNDSMLFCDSCKQKLGLFNMVLSARNKKKGETYLVHCKRCRCINKRVKGEIGDKFDRDWDKYGV